MFEVTGSVKHIHLLYYGRLGRPSFVHVDSALRRRGFPAEAINNFCAGMGVTGAQMGVDPQKLEAVVKDTLDLTAPRSMVVLVPLKVTILNFPFDGPTTIDVPDFPKEVQRGSHSVNLDRVIYID